jgi:5-methylcytosine-specific restriction endonuclease McrA
MTKKISLRKLACNYTKAEIKSLARKRMGQRNITKAKATEMGIPWPLPRGWQVVAAGLVPASALDGVRQARKDAQPRQHVAKVKTPKATKGGKPSGDSFYSSWEWKKVRYEALAKFAHRCQCCGWQPGDTTHGYLVVDHIKPRRHFPELALDVNNTQILCNDCNMGKGHIYHDDFRRLDEAYKTMLMQ